MQTLWQDLRYGLRLLAKSPGFTIVAVLTLALGIGANTAIFSFVYTAVLRGLPYREPSRLVAIWQKDAHGETDSVSPGDLVAWERTTHSFEGLAFAGRWKFYTLTGANEPDEVWAWPVSTNLFQLLGARPFLGRTFSPDESGAVVISHQYWQKHFASDRHVIGRSLALDGEQYTVIGVMPPNFYFDSPAADLWVSWSLTPQDIGDHENRFLSVVGRLKRGVTLRRARLEMQSIQNHLASVYAKEDSGRTVVVDRMKAQGLADFQAAIVALVGAVLFTLLIACVNVANMFLGRGAARQREMAVRSALGARRWRLARQLLTETLLVSVLSGLAGIVLAIAMIRLLVHLLPTYAPQEIAGLHEITLNLPALEVALALSVVTGIAVGLLPALRGYGVDLSESLRNGAAAVGPLGSRVHVRDLFVLCQTALALILLVGAGLMLRSFHRLATVNPGFNTNHVLTVRVPLVARKYSQGVASASFYEDVLQRIRAVPGVQSAAMVNDLPMGGFRTTGYFSLPKNSGGPELGIPAGLQDVSPGYFRAMGIPLLRGRDFTPEDQRKDSTKVAIVDEAMARRYWPGQDAVGKPLYPDNTIVGVVGDTRRDSLRGDPEPEVYIPYIQHPFASFLITFVIRTASDPLSLAQAMRKAVWEIDHDQPVIQVRTMDNVVAESIWRPRLSATLLTILALIALALSTAGVYGVLSYSVTRRTHEIGVRVALGAHPHDVLLAVLGRSMLFAAIGLAAGTLGSLALTHVLRSVLFGIKPTDPVSFAGAVLVLAAVALAASYIPAQRAMRVDPMVALRHE